MWKEFGEANENDFHLASRRFCSVLRLRKGKAGLVFSWGGKLLTWTGDIVEGLKEHFEEILNPNPLYMQLSLKTLGGLTHIPVKGHLGSQEVP